jgi:hypothetical protein
LGAGVIEFAGLPDDDRPGADDQNLFDVSALWHLGCLQFPLSEARYDCEA